jgi:HEAT repeat protein
MTLLRGLFLVVAAVAVGAVDRASAEEIRPEFAMYDDPLLVEPITRWHLQDGLVELWQQVLQRPEADYQRQAAEAIAEAAEEDLSGLEPTRPLLREIVTRQSSHAAAVYAAARALVALQDRRSAAALWEAGQKHGQTVRLMVEPALAAWEFAPAASQWRQRLEDPQTGRRDLMLALEGLAQLQAADALPAMLTIVHSAERPADVRLTAARAAGSLVETGLESEVARLSAGPQASVLQRLCAVALLQRHATPAATEHLERLAADAEPGVAEPALGRLLEVDPQRSVPLAAGAIGSSDPKLRRKGADVYVALPTADRTRALLQLLDDPHPAVRSSVREDLYRLAAQPELRSAVLEGGLQVLAGPGWRGQEQAALLLGALDHEPAAPRLLELLLAERPEVMVATAWALRKLAVDDTRVPILEHARRQTAVRLQQTPPAGLDEQVAHLFEALGLMKEPAAEELLREYVPKRIAYGYYSRGAAIWALGVLHAGTEDEELASQLMERLNDTDDPFNPEMDIVHEMSAVTLGRMQASSQSSALQVRLKSGYGRTLLAIRWAIEQITGESLPPLPPEDRFKTNWFIEPLGRSSEAEPTE